MATDRLVASSAAPLTARATRLREGDAGAQLSGAPDDGFVLERRGAGVSASGIARRVSVSAGPNQVARAAEAAATALAEIRGDADAPPVIVGALPFDGETPATLVVPRAAVVRREDGEAWRIDVAADGDDGQSTAAPSVGAGNGSSAGGATQAGSEGARQTEFVVEPEPDPSVFVDAVGQAVTRIRDGELVKVVLARTLRIRAAAAFDVEAALARLREREPDAYVFAAQGFVGASPELLIARAGDRVHANPLGGTAPRTADPAEDRRASAALLTSGKDLREHAPTAEAVVRGLSPVCEALDVRGPSVLAAGTVWHLSTEVTGTLRQPAPSSLALASLLHPMPAVCGSPADAAMALIAALEPFDRSIYGGLVGWMDANGDGEWILALRCARVDGAAATLYAGVGIVADSDPAAELAETDAKFGPMLDALGIARIPPG